MEVIPCPICHSEVKLIGSGPDVVATCPGCGSKWTMDAKSYEDVYEEEK